MKVLFDVIGDNYGFNSWKQIIDMVISLITSNILTAGFFFIMIVRIFIDIIGATFNKDGTRKESN